MRKGLAKRGCRAMRWLKPRHAQGIARGSSVGCTHQLPHGCWAKAADERPVGGETKKWFAPTAKALRAMR